MKKELSILDLTKKELKKKKIDVAYFINTDNDKDFSIEYVLGQGFDTALLAVYSSPKKPLLCISPLEEATKKTKQISSVQLFGRDNPPFDIFAKNITQKKTLVIGLHEKALSKKFHSIIKKRLKQTLKKKNILCSFVDISDLIESQRQRKTKKELVTIKKAVQITETLFEELFKNFSKKEFKNEDDVVIFLKKRMLDFNCVPSFEPVVASGSHSSLPHYRPIPNTKIKPGFCVIDMGVKYNEYCSDMTRTIYFGMPKKSEKDMYEKVKASLEKTEKKVFPDSIPSNLFADFQKNNFPLIHALGHGLGHDVHESPVLAHVKIPIQENMVFAIEPGMYDIPLNKNSQKKKNKQQGIRIEDNYVVTKTGVKRLGTLSRNLQSFPLP